MSRNRAVARRVLLRRLIARGRISSQEELVRLLAQGGHRVTQTTVSRDLAELGVDKVEGRSGPVYSLPRNCSAPATGDDALGRMLRSFVVQIDHSRNLVLIKTPPGGAGAVASALDGAPPAGVLGTLAGDDTVLVVTGSDNAGARVARKLERMLGG